jgi:pilus assembly protein Flp/PilA
MFDFIRYGIPAYVQGLRNREEGQSLVEYALILALISVVAIAVLGTIGDNVVARLQEVSDALL